METNGDGKKLNQAGRYVHKGSGAVVFLNTMPDVGTPQIDAFVQAGFVREDEPKDEPKTVVTEDSPELKQELKDEYTEKETKTGAIQYRKNGKLISKDEYDNKLTKEQNG